LRQQPSTERINHNEDQGQTKSHTLQNFIRLFGSWQLTNQTDLTKNPIHPGEQKTDPKQQQARATPSPVVSTGRAIISHEIPTDTEGESGKQK
jgi:hypothetical protein